MIRFQGELSQSSKQKMVKNMQQATAKYKITAYIFIFIFGVSLGLFFTRIFQGLMVLGVWLAFVALFLSYLSNLPKKNPQEVVFANDKMIVEGEDFKYVTKISDVKLVIDAGDCYLFRFRRGFYKIDLSFYGCMQWLFVCQKDLLVEGTLEEFEKLFSGKIVKRDISVSEEEQKNKNEESDKHRKTTKKDLDEFKD